MSLIVCDFAVGYHQFRVQAFDLILIGNNPVFNEIQRNLIREREK